MGKGKKSTGKGRATGAQPKGRQAPSRPLEGEDIATTRWEDARHWMSLYADLLEFKDGIRARRVPTRPCFRRRCAITCAGFGRSSSTLVFRSTWSTSQAAATHWCFAPTEEVASVLRLITSVIYLSLIDAVFSLL